jgi:hypothetical protein
VPRRTYRVVVRGRLSPALVAAFEDFEAGDVDGGLTPLVGTVSDQEALHRLFRMLSDLNIELVSVNPVRENDGQRERGR